MAGRVAWRCIVATAWVVWLVCGIAMWRDWIDRPTASFIGLSALVSLLLLTKLGIKRRLIGERSPALSPQDSGHIDA
jgi:hypothetical protein